MDFNLISDPLRTTLVILTGVMLLAFLAAFILFFIKDGSKKVFAAWLLVTALVIGCGIAAQVDDDSNRRENDTKFSQQLMNEYGATSDRSFYEIRGDFEKYNESTAKFARDGSETTVSIKKISEQDGKLVMAFRVLDEKSLYPKIAK